MYKKKDDFLIERKNKLISDLEQKLLEEEKLREKSNE